MCCSENGRPSSKCTRGGPDAYEVLEPPSLPPLGVVLSCLSTGPSLHEEGSVSADEVDPTRCENRSTEPSMPESPSLSWFAGALVLPGGGGGGTRRCEARISAPAYSSSADVADERLAPVAEEEEAWLLASEHSLCVSSPEQPEASVAPPCLPATSGLHGSSCSQALSGDGARTSSAMKAFSELSTDGRSPQSDVISWAPPAACSFWGRNGEGGGRGCVRRESPPAVVDYATALPSFLSRVGESSWPGACSSGRRKGRPTTAPVDVRQVALSEVAAPRQSASHSGRKGQSIGSQKSTRFTSSVSLPERHRGGRQTRARAGSRSSSTLATEACIHPDATRRPQRGTPAPNHNTPAWV